MRIRDAKRETRGSADVVGSVPQSDVRNGVHRPPVLSPCYGVACQDRAECSRYVAVDGVDPREKAITTCVSMAGKRPGFVGIWGD